MKKVEKNKNNEIKKKKSTEKNKKDSVPQDNIIKEKFKALKRKINNFIHNPKPYFRRLRDIIVNNKLFVVFVILNVLNAAVLRAFVLGSHTIFDFDTILADLTFVLLIGSFTHLFREQGKFIYMFIVTVLLSAICVINSSYYTFYSEFSSISQLSTAQFITDVGDAVVENVLEPKDLIYILSPIILLFLHYVYKKKDYKYLHTIRRNRNGFIGTICIAIGTGIIFAFTLTGTDISRLTKLWMRESVVEKYGIYIYHVNDLVKSLEPKFAALFGYDSALKEFNEFYSDVKQPATNEFTGIFEGKNILVIHGESMQNFLIGLEFNGQEVTPNLNKLAAKGMYFNNFYSQVHIGTSSDTEFTLNTSLMPASIGTAFVDYADKEYVSIPKLLKEKGYYSFAMHANKGNFWNRRTMHLNLGYDHLYAKDEFVIDEEIGLGLSDVSFFKQAVQKLKTITEEHDKYYGTFIMLSNHTPFSDVEKYGEFDVDIKETVINPETGKEEVISHPYMEGTKLGNYFKSAHYADYALGIFFDELEKERLLDNTVVIFYGDHDARLDQSEYERLYNYDITTDDIKDEDDPTYIDFNEYEYELNRKVPFIIWSKDSDMEPVTYSYPMGMYDVMPTLGNMFGFYNKYALGHDIFNVKDDNIVIFPTGNWLTKDLYYNSNKEEYYNYTFDKTSDTPNNFVVSQKMIDDNNQKVDKILAVSNNILVYDLIRNSKK